MTSLDRPRLLIRDYRLLDSSAQEAKQSLFVSDSVILVLIRSPGRISSTCVIPARCPWWSLLCSVRTRFPVTMDSKLCVPYGRTLRFGSSNTFLCRGDAQIIALATSCEQRLPPHHPSSPQRTIQMRKEQWRLEFAYCNLLKYLEVAGPQTFRQCVVVVVAEPCFVLPAFSTSKKIIYWTTVLLCTDNFSSQPLLCLP